MLMSVLGVFSHHEEQKNRAYNARILEVERGVLTPLVFSTSGGVGEEAKTLFKRVAAKMANKTGQTYSETINPHQEETAFRPSKKQR